MKTKLIKRVTQLSLIGLFGLFFASSVSGQNFSENIDLSDTTQLHIVETKRGDRFVGRITKIENTTVYFLFRNESPLEFKFQDLSLVWVAGENPPGDTFSNEGEKSQKYFDAASHAPEYLLYSPTAFNYPKGGGAYRNTDILWNTVDFGVTNNLSFGGGAIIPFFFVFRGKGTFELTPQFRFGFGQNTFVPFIPDVSSASHFFAVASVGKAERFLNFSFGYWIDWDQPSDPYLVYTGGGGFNITESWRIIIDVFYMNNEDVGVIPSLMLSWMSNKNTVDFGFFNVPDTDVPLFPAISYQRRF